MVMLTVLIGVIFIGFPISFTMLFLAFVFGYFGSARRCSIWPISRRSG